LCVPFAYFINLFIYSHAGVRARSPVYCCNTCRVAPMPGSPQGQVSCFICSFYSAFFSFVCFNTRRVAPMSGRIQRKVPFFICSFVFPRLFVCLFILTQGQVTPDTPTPCKKQYILNPSPLHTTTYNLPLSGWSGAKAGTEGQRER